MENDTIIDMWLRKKRKAYSYNKWCKAVELTRKKITFSSRRGFHDLKIVGVCGYCEEFLEGWNCFKCPLFKREACNKRPNNSVFWKYVEEMQKIFKKSINDSPEVNWGKAVSLSILMRETIREDIESIKAS